MLDAIVGTVAAFAVMFAYGCSAEIVSAVKDYLRPQDEGVTR